VVPDNKYPTMWRVRSPDGALSDMVNRTRAKDAAMALLVTNLNMRGKAQGASPAVPRGQPTASAAVPYTKGTIPDRPWQIGPPVTGTGNSGEWNHPSF